MKLGMLETKTIFSLYDYLQSNRVSKYFNNNKTEIDTSNIKIKNNTNIGVLQYNSKNPLKKELFDKKIKIIKDKNIIDIPLLCNQENFEVRKSAGDIEKKLLHLEFFIKKKFDELVKEIKIYIPIHFNSHVKDYNIIEK
jgi:hypothetical protein